MPGPTSEDVEMRFMVERSDFDVFDAVCKARRLPKNAIAREIVAAWCKQVVHESMMVQRMQRSNGNEPQSDWGSLSE